jgi:hypothetical protein
MQEIPLKSSSIFDNISTILYDIQGNESAGVRGEKIGRFEKADSFPVLWARKNKTIDLKNFLASVRLLDDTTIRLELRFGPEGALRPEEALDFISGPSGRESPAFSVRKIQVHFKDSEACPVKS